MVTIAEFVELKQKAKKHEADWMSNYLRGYCTPLDLQSLADALNCKADTLAVSKALRAL